MIVLRTLLENNLSQNRALIAEHGLSFMVETEDVKILFDCGAGSAAGKNSVKMNVSLRDFKPETYPYFKDTVIVDDWEEVCRENTVIELWNQQYGLSRRDVLTMMHLPGSGKPAVPYSAPWVWLCLTLPLRHITAAGQRNWELD